jgi:hypothetical protein
VPGVKGLALGADAPGTITKIERREDMSPSTLRDHSDRETATSSGDVSLLLDKALCSCTHSFSVAMLGAYVALRE